MFWGCKTMFDKIKGIRTAKKISNFFSENYDPLSDSMFTPKQDLDINIDSPESLKFIKDITVFLNGKDKVKQLSYTMKKLHINDLVKWALILKQIVQNYGKSLNEELRYTSYFYYEDKLDLETVQSLDNFLRTHLADSINKKAEKIKGGQRPIYESIAQKLKTTKIGAPKFEGYNREENDEKNKETNDEPLTSDFIEIPNNEFIKKLKKILDNTFIPLDRSEISSADLEVYRKIASVLPNSDQSFDNTYSKLIRTVGESGLIKKCLLDKNYRKKFSPKQIIKLQRYYHIANESTQKKKGKTKKSYIDYSSKNDDVYNVINLDELDNRIPHGAITFDPRYKDDRKLYYINQNPINKADGFSTLHDIGVDSNQQDIDKPPVIEAHTSSNGGGSRYEITHCFFRVKATEFDPSVITYDDLKHKNKNKNNSLEQKALKRRSYSFGFYPKKQLFLSEKSGGKYRTFPGMLKDDRVHYSQLAVARTCDNVRILKLNEAVHKFTQNNDYSLCSKNCTAFVSKVSKEIGFKDISKMFGKYIFAPNIAAKNIISAWMGGKYNGTDTTFKATSHKMRIYKEDTNKKVTEEAEHDEGFYVKYQKALDRSVISMENMKIEDNDDLYYSTIEDYLTKFIGKFYDELPNQKLEFTSQLENTLKSLKSLFDLTKYSEKGVDAKTVQEHKSISKNQLELLEDVFKDHSNYRGFLFVRFLIKRIDSGLIELLIKKGYRDAIQDKLHDAEDIYNEKYDYFDSVQYKCSDRKYEELRAELDRANDVCDDIEEQLQSINDEYSDMLKRYHEDSIN